MSDLDPICFALWAVAPIYLGIRRAALRAPRRSLPPRPIPRPVLALALLGIAAWLGTRADLATALVTALAACTAMASVMVLLVPTRPRPAWLLAVLAPCVAAIVTLCAGGCHGA